MRPAKFPGWRTMTGAQRYNAKAAADFEYARQQGHVSFNPTHDAAVAAAEALAALIRTNNGANQ